ncbi:MULTISPECIES: adenylate kinase [Pseudonocardia]|uniref:Adenylate kinase n=2 Tax=Pseudonocardia TaxID=1847 RepID=A0A1Y2N1M5_PSEAH|nr:MULTISPECIES: adenylate kinase [Pseudonocardia]OSY40997.1 Adenylate kinase [Pseudonocardia autotrophica]TDN73875.1 adenylate kinase [Pseudonocardia autotrophica]BBG04625.1 adenylate kinase [Pseudonocardia autotrophica]GEC25673.1 adenylate kinase [Pseudonocardia saturnea]
MRLVLVGPPGAGKGTQAERMAERLDVPHISTGDLFRANLRDETELGREAKRYMDAGDLVPDEVTVGMVRDRLGDADTTKGFILDGFPRNTAQAASLGEILKDKGLELDAVVQFDVEDEVVVQRLLGRGRSDDNEDTIRNRQRVYREETAPLLDHYRDQLVTIDAVGEVGEITDRVFEALKKHGA